MGDPLTLTEYAKRRGVSVKSVSIAVSSGRLAACVVRDRRGQPKISSAELADREWAANTRQRADRTSGAQRQTSDVPAVPAPAASAPLGLRLGDLPAGVPTYHVSQAVRAAAAARRESAQADMAELELAKERGRLVDADQVHADFASHISMAKARLLAVPTRVAQDMPDIAPRVVPALELLIREALEELAVDGRAE